MLPLFILGVALLIGVMLLGRWFVAAEPKALLKIFKWASLVIVIVVASFLLLTGRLALALFALPALFGWFLRFRSIARTAKNFSRMAAAGSGTTNDDTSEVQTRFFNMVLNHASGDMDGEIVSGSHQGKWLRDLDETDLLSLLDECRQDDEQSALVLEAYLDRTHPDWRQQTSSRNSNADATMDRETALQVLGLTEGASKEEIKEAHHRLMAGMHPDHGGSTYLASKINQAKDFLLGN